MLQKFQFLQYKMILSAKKILSMHCALFLCTLLVHILH